MALSNQNSNFISELQNMASGLLQQQRDIDLMIARWNENDMFNVLTNEDVQAIPSFAHLTTSEISNAITAITAVTTALGNLSTGKAVDLLKLKG